MSPEPKLIWIWTDAAAHDGARLIDLIDGDNKARDV